MNSVGIVTIYDERNYGNRLQNYAVNKVVEQLGYCPVNLIYEGSVNASLGLAIKCWVYDLFYNKLQSYHRLKLFKNFTKMHMPSAQIVKTDTNVDCKYVLCGSDQIWNPTWAGHGFYFAPFVNQEKRIAYAASFGVARIPNDRVQEYTANLKGMHAISVREEAGAEIIEELTGKRPAVLIDPTMMLTKQEWQAVSKQPAFFSGKKYALTYFLGELTEGMRKYFRQVCEQKDLELINLEKLHENNYWYSTGPAEFLWLIQHCEIMFTDSFHGSVFSILFEVPFLVWNKIEKGLSSSSRIDTLLTTLKLENRRYGMCDDRNLFQKEYTHVEAILEEERRKSKEFLMRAMEIDE